MQTLRGLRRPPDRPQSGLRKASDRLSEASDRILEASDGLSEAPDRLSEAFVRFLDLRHDLRGPRQALRSQIGF